MKQLFRRILLVSVALFIASSTLGLALPQLAQKAMAAGCPAPDIMFGRYKWCGYFYSRFEDHGTYVRDAGVPASVNNVNAFISMLEGDLYSGDVHRNAGAATIIRIMGGAPVPSPLPVGSPKPVTPAMITEFENRLRGFSTSSENGSQSFGSSGHIDWFHSDFMHCGDYNSYYQQTYHDVAPYVITSSNTPECNNSGIRFDHIFVYDTSGNIIWRVRRLCMNPLGNLPALPVAQQPYNLLPNVSVTQGAAPLANGSYVDAGSSVTFNYTVNNTLSGTATGIACNLYANNYTGFHAIPSPADATGGPPAGPTCTNTFGPGITNLGSETVNNLPANTSVCRTVYVNPNKPTGGISLGYEACVYVTAKPYFRTYGGDISAGNGQPAACGTSVNAAIVSWNRESAGGFGGAGVQYAGYALDVIYDVATDLGNAAGSAAPPAGLSFANTTASGPSNYGGSFGAASLPCIADYYGTPTGTLLPAIHPLPSLNDTYTASGPVTLSGDVPPGKKVVIYVNGNVIINGPIRYPGTWSVDDIPLFAVIAKGNIYIDGSVGELNGTYIAQGGTIYTCASGQVPAVPTSAGFYASCSGSLVVNGAFIAQQVQLLRAKGSVGLSSAGETNASTNIGEIFNYNPAFWIPQPTSGKTTVDYDAITSLPPIL
ncbi:MAG TPA: hypothetical protein VLI54_02160 [Bacillota bacterium]|nr:hypothetical protein [Bacillota bacterium]